MQSKFAYTHPESVHAQKNCKNMCKIHVVYRFICFWGQEFQKCNQNFHTLAQGLCTCKTIAKMCAKYMLYIDLYDVFWGQEFQKCNQNFYKLAQGPCTCKKNLQKCVQYTCCISIYMFLGSSISKMQPKLSYTCPGPMHMQKKIAKMCAKFMLYIDLYVLEPRISKMQPKILLN